MKVLLSVVLLLFLLLSLSFSIDESVMKLQEEAMDRAMIAFGLAKALNAVISLIQGTELSFTPVGVGLVFSVGEVLDPFNDMVERFSWVMLGASVSLGVAKLLLVLSAKLFLQIVLGVSVLISLSLLWFNKFHNSYTLVYALKFFVLIILLRFGALVFVYSSALLYTSTLENEYKQASKIVEKTQSQLQELHKQNEMIIESNKNDGFFDGVSSKYNKIIQNLNISKQLEDLEKSINDASKKIVSLITIFVVETLLMPLLFLYFMIISIKFVLRVEISEEKLKKVYN